MLSYSFWFADSVCCLFFFFFNDTATTEIYTLSLHDALPVCAPTHQLPTANHQLPLLGTLGGPGEGEEEQHDKQSQDVAGSGGVGRTERDDVSRAALGRTAEGGCPHASLGSPEGAADDDFALRHIARS